MVSVGWGYGGRGTRDGTKQSREKVILSRTEGKYRRGEKHGKAMGRHENPRVASVRLGRHDPKGGPERS